MRTPLRSHHPTRIADAILAPCSRLPTVSRLVGGWNYGSLTCVDCRSRLGRGQERVYPYTATLRLFSSGIGIRGPGHQQQQQQQQRVATISGSTPRVAEVIEQVRVTSVADGVDQQPVFGPMQEYEARVQSGRLKDDAHQRDIIQHLQDLHEILRSYTPPVVVHPTISSLQNPEPRPSFLGSLFSRTPPRAATTQIPPNLPKGLYMFGDVGCGKTMLMDLFFDTLPENITSRQRIHFHNFMQDVHKRLHVMKMEHGNDFDAVPFVAADIVQGASVLCFDEFQCTDVADAMILRRLLESLMSHGVILVTTSNRHPDDLYKNGIQRESFIPCITLLKTSLTVLNLDSATDYRKIPRPPSGVYHHPLGMPADHHADKWFEYLGDFSNDPPHSAVHQVWGRDVEVPLASGKAARFTFQQLIGRATGAADYLELMRSYDAFIVTDVPGMTIRERDLARRFITFIDAVYESRAKLVLTTAVPPANLFLSNEEVQESMSENKSSSKDNNEAPEYLPDAMRHLMDDLGLSMSALKSSSIFNGDEERFAFARALSRLAEMEGKEWVERGLGIGMDAKAGDEDKAAWNKARSRWREDS
ncbi:lactation elevated protein [Paracoccidioides lutzii Pb01]|uniref:Lactation elevated protein n=1 Tax=Paracoccidioides lutzii (strain ATCC MYA-826 / Pb01) TaxID=502779 RepID=C1HC95_PARBA|nr:lactation elevated protein [Paracoccidioides lutzii Pb01]EEH38659.1 lactation elevated protein [Paracoccidioides lutzii Pb01]